MVVVVGLVLAAAGAIAARVAVAGPQRTIKRESALILAAMLVAQAFGAPPSAAAATGTTAIFIDDESLSGNATLDTYASPEVPIVAEWSGITLIITAFAVPGSQIIKITPARGEPLLVGTYTEQESLELQPQSSGSECSRSVTINAIAPVPQPGVRLESLDTLSATFGLRCPFSDIRGEVRVASADPLDAVGVAAAAAPRYPVRLLTADSFVGRPSEPGSVVLKNRGTRPLQFGALSVSAEALQRWTITRDSCSGELLAVGATCEIAGTTVSWVPGTYEEPRAVIPVSTVRGLLRIAMGSKAMAGSFVPIEPTRLVDSRIGLGISSALRSREARTFVATDRVPDDPLRNVPATAVALVGNLTLTKQESAGYLSLTDEPTANPTVSTINAPSGETRANGVIIRLGLDGSASLTWVGPPLSSAHAVFDATGYFIPSQGPSPPYGGNFGRVEPVRVLDTRTGVGFRGRLTPNVPRTFSLAIPSIPATSTAVAGNLTITNSSGAGFVSIGPTPTAQPTSSTLNFRANESRANNVITKFGPNRTLSVTYVGPPGTSVDVIFDVNGAFGGGRSGYVPLRPSRIVDSRIGLGLAGKLRAQTSQVADVSNIHPGDPARNVPPDYQTPEFVMTKSGLTVNVTFIAPTSAGYLTVLATAAVLPPKTSTVNAPRGDTRANGALVPKGTSPLALQFWYGAVDGAATHVVVDVTGYFTR